MAFAPWVVYTMRMRPIIIGAGRGSRLQHNTEQVPKTLVPVMGRPMLDWILDAQAEAGFSRKDVIFIGGYKIDVVKARYPEFEYVENTDWPNNNILGSLLCARHLFNDGFTFTYADIVYDGAIAKNVTQSPHSIALGCDVKWRRRYVARSQHPETDAEKLRAEGERVVEISRKIDSDRASGEFIGVAKFDASGAAELVRAYDEAKSEWAGKVFREGRTFEKAYVIDLLQWMIERGSIMHRVDTPGAYMELDTIEDLSFASSWWESRG
ncbi:MAG: NTP transferase domain-containing protein [Polyangiaceae bacterium]